MNKKLNIMAAAALSCILSFSASAQVPAGFNYQAVVRNAGGTLIASQNVGVKITVQDGASAALYTEERTVMTTPQGLLNVQVGGAGATTTTGDLSSIDWGKSSTSMKVEIDPAGGTSYTDMGTSPFMSVPYARFSNGLQATSNGGLGVRGSGTSNLWLGFYEADIYRGYIGSYAGKNEDMDFGTGGGNTLGSVHLTVAAVPKLTVDSIGNVGVGTRFPKYRFQVDGVTGSFNDNGIRINNTTASSGWSLYSSSSGALIIGRSGNLGQFDGVSGVYTSLSDRRAKTNIQDVTPVLSKVMTLAPKTYQYKVQGNQESKQYIGFIAQDVYDVFPQFVSVNTNNDGNAMFENQMGVDYASMSTIAIKAIQEQQAIIEQLKARIAALEQQVANQK
ncbi:MAG TPA: tail fiber domain-containing protein [Flavipsychrobacter sp.]